MALRINGSGVSLVEYNIQKQQLLSAAETTGKTLADDEISKLLEEYFVTRELLAQAAFKAGYDPSDAELDGKLNNLIESSGGEEQFQTWLAANGYTTETFMPGFKRELAAQWQRDKIVAEVGDTAEQIHGRQILVQTEDAAGQIFRQLQGGSDFTELAALYDPVTKGDLGWFPRGFLFLPDLEAKIFELQPGQYTDVLQSEYGYHIVFVEERETNHPLSDTARNKLTHMALSEWLLEQRNSSEIETLLP
jgi:peptidyl-prolyl cis-trans isomerase C